MLMKTWRLALALGIAALLFVPARAQNLEADLQRAIQKETVSGDLKAAIEDYRKIADRAGANKTLAAQALLHMAECHQKLGDAEARAIYERIVRDFGDQKDVAALATARILQSTTGASARGGFALSNRVVWTVPSGPYFWGNVSPDGRYLAYDN
jgi:outer membrane protein assembly factor BamD (BamD/ComL family)